MRKKIFVGLAVLALAACSGDSDAGDEAVGEAMTETAEATADEVAEAATEAPTQATASAPSDAIRGRGGMEEKCLARVNETVGGGVIGTNRIEEAESGVMIYVNVQGASAPWQCFGSRDGTISEVFFGGDEGAL